MVGQDVFDGTSRGQGASVTGQAELDCTGYRVVTDDSSLGTVVAMLSLAYGHEGGLLIVRPDEGCNLIAFSLDEVEDVDVRREQLLVRTSIQ